MNPNALSYNVYSNHTAQQSAQTYKRISYLTWSKSRKLLWQSHRLVWVDNVFSHANVTVKMQLLLNNMFDKGSFNRAKKKILAF